MKNKVVLGESGKSILRFWRGVALGGLALVVPAIVLAQSPPQLYIYPLKKQSKAQEDKDRYECHRWAVQHSGYDPSRTHPNNPSYLDPQPYRPSQPHVVRGAGRGAALGAVGGAITGNAGKGAAAGAAMGGLTGGFRRRSERRRQAAQQQANATSAVASQQMNYTRAMAACLEGRGYSVK
jgi:Glycine-zipper domain